MSRFTKVSNGIEVAYGHDHMCGWFVQVFNLGEDDPIIDLDELRDGLNKITLKHVGLRYNIYIPSKDLEKALEVTPRERFLHNKKKFRF